MNQDESAAGVDSWFNLAGTNPFSRILGFTVLASFLNPTNRDTSYIASGGWMLILGTLLEVGRRFCQWLYERFDIFQYSLTASFDEGDPAYEWIILFLTDKKLWKRSRFFHVTARTSARKWGVKTGPPRMAEHVDCVPTYEAPQLFQWKGYWAEIKRDAPSLMFSEEKGSHWSRKIFLTIYSKDVNALSALLEDARQLYLEVSQPNVIIRTADKGGRMGYDESMWLESKAKPRRALSSIILQEGVMQSILEDAREFIDSEEWYTLAGIPYRRGYLLHGPPGTGKSSTIYGIAGELGLEIYSLSLASQYVDDSFLQRSVSAIPKQAIFLIEDIDCAFPSREELNEMDEMPHYGPFPRKTKSGRPMSQVTLSGLLNVLDGVGSDEGKIFFATTNYVENLDPALLRPGRIDRKIQYYLATKTQAEALFIKFYPASLTTLSSELSASPSGPNVVLEKSPMVMNISERQAALVELAKEFASHVPEHEFSTAELQGYLLMWKKSPESAVSGVSEWVEVERKERKERLEREEERKQQLKEKREAQEAERLQGSLTRIGGTVVIAPPVADDASVSTVVNGEHATGNTANASPASTEASTATEQTISAARDSSTTLQVSAS
ncbi:hypothetical protein M413DRAFT_445204 [Hebeloma cylindrosporum]|uniref:AAA+ ATPase domain-containing protein n=1 Tax=Hebeloma cylindrosporum TaxID=76867 RepID=A0A0C2XWH9_HEBCY|nr:hypothetical protein M413DRAFT_445204 [Hebeloma cylindrosporum h7]